MVKKEIISASKAASMIEEGSVVMVGGFMGCGSPPGLIAALAERGTGELTLVCNDCGNDNRKTGYKNGVASLINNRQFKRVIASHIGLNHEIQRQMIAGETEVELVPQGTLAERVRSAGVGLGGILTPTGIGTEVEKGKEVIQVDGKSYLLESPLGGDVALLRANRADRAGNLILDKTTKNFNPLIAMAAKLVIVESDEIVEIGEISPESVTIPGIFVDFLTKSKEVL